MSKLFLWLRILKSGGYSTSALLGPNTLLMKLSHPHGYDMSVYRHASSYWTRFVLCIRYFKTWKSFEFKSVLLWSKVCSCLSILESKSARYTRQAFAWRILPLVLQVKVFINSRILKSLHYLFCLWWQNTCNAIQFQIMKFMISQNFDSLFEPELLRKS